MAATKANIKHKKTLDIPCPILTRWWTVGVAVSYLLEHWELIFEVCKGLI